MMFAKPLLSAVLLAAISLPALAQEKTQNLHDWRVETADNPKECWIVSAPKKSEAKRDGKPTEVKRSDIMLVASWQKGKGVTISYTGGYPFKAGSEVTMVLDGKKHPMITQGEWAWLKDEAGDDAVVKAMRAGKEMVLLGTSERETETKDFFSMKGVTAASTDAQEKCK